jgi:hypothetical protein
MPSGQNGIEHLYFNQYQILTGFYELQNCRTAELQNFLINLRENPRCPVPGCNQLVGRFGIGKTVVIIVPEQNMLPNPGGYVGYMGM